MLRFLFAISLTVLTMSTHAGNYFPPNYKIFPFNEGDLLASQRSGGKFSINKILKIDRIVIKAGASINIQGKIFVATEDDYLLIVSASYGEDEFSTFEEARAAAKAGKWKVKLNHTPNRAPGAAAGQTHVGNAPVTQSELEGYKLWRKAFDNGSAGVF